MSFQGKLKIVTIVSIVFNPTQGSGLKVKR